MGFWGFASNLCFPICSSLPTAALSAVLVRSVQEVFGHSSMLCEVNVALQQVGEFHQALFLPQISCKKHEKWQVSPSHFLGKMWTQILSKNVGSKATCCKRSARRYFFQGHKHADLCAQHGCYQTPPHHRQVHTHETSPERVGTRKSRVQIRPIQPRFAEHPCHQNRTFEKQTLAHCCILTSKTECDDTKIEGVYILEIVQVRISSYKDHAHHSTSILSSSVLNKLMLHRAPAVRQVVPIHGDKWTYSCSLKPALSLQSAVWRTCLPREPIHNDATRESTYKAPVKVVPAKVEGTHCPVPLPVQKTSDLAT